ncbi:MAG TPA: SUMF1/EgtB/PvdO family nonheme iron enzyme [Ktedonobacterales bacterium]|nr:SUMF1/EgtB/PvdO family nonheme iron enzyme [Ktedonobacterales bacterium]
MVAPRVFVSSTPSDVEVCSALVADLRAAGADVWFEPTGAEDTEHELASRACFIVMLSPDALKARQVQFEVAGALQLVRTGAIRTLLPVLLEGCVAPPVLAAFRSITIDTHDGTSRAPDWSAVRDTLGLRETRASERALVPQSVSAMPPSVAAEPIVLPPQLTKLGFTGWHVRELDIIVPPLSLVTGGPFQMGCQGAEAKRNEQPAHTVTLPTFAITTYPLTVAEYACFVGAGHALPRDMGRITWNGQFSRLDHPVVNVSWYDATAYADWLSAHTGGRWRLPSEAEWERAARWDPLTQVAREYPWGDAFDKERCNTRESTIGSTTPIHIYSNGASPCGARDMVGNVREWTGSVYAPYPFTANGERERADASGERVQRGGSWFSFASDVRAAEREWHAPDDVSPFVGFRLVLEASPVPRT